VMQDATTPMDEVCAITAGNSFLLMARETGCSPGRRAVASGPWIAGLLGNTRIGGDSRKVKPGDIIIIPAGTPHSFSELDGPISYLVYRFEPSKK